MALRLVEVLLFAVMFVCSSRWSAAQVVAPVYAGSYTAFSLPLPTDVPAKFGGLLFLQDDPSILLLVGLANEPTSIMYAVPVIRDPVTSHITGFGNSTVYASAPQADGGLVYFPGTSTLLYTGYPTNTVGEITGGSNFTELTLDLNDLQIDSSVGGVSSYLPTSPALDSQRSPRLIRTAGTTWSTSH